ncbi:MAG: AAA family ATPase, partial [Bacteroidota bacterium]
RQLEIMKQDYDSASGDRPTFFDRGLPDLIAWRAYERLDIDDVVTDVFSHPYEQLAFITPVWPEIYVQDALRPFTLEQAGAINEMIRKTYLSLGHKIRSLPCACPHERALFVLDAVWSARGTEAAR